MKQRFVLMAVVVVTIAGIGSADAALLTSYQRQCLRRIMDGARRYSYNVGQEIRNSIYYNQAPTSRYCASGRACIGGANHSLPCATNADCAGGGCYPNLFTGGGVARRILYLQNQFRTYASNYCSAVGVTPGNLLYPSALCPNATDFDGVVDCILRNAGDRESGQIIDVNFESFRRAATHLPVPHPADFGTYPTAICGVPGSSLFQLGSDSTENSVGRGGGTRLLTTAGCAGDVCSTQGESVADFGGNLLGDPVQTYVGIIPVCIVSQPQDVGNGTFESGSINLTTGDQSSLQTVLATILLGTTCPKCLTSSGVCDSGPRAGLSCLRRGSEDLTCPPSIPGSPLVMPLRLDLTTGTSTLSVPANNPAGGATNPAGTFCGACDMNSTIACQNDADCVSQAVCSGAVGSGCCQFGTNTGFAHDACGPPTTSISAQGATGPFIPHLAGVSCVGQSGDGLVDAIAGLPGPMRYVEPRLNVYAW